MTIPIEIVPIAVLSVAVLAIVLGLGLQRRTWARRRPQNPWVAIVMSAIGLLVFAGLFVASDRDERTYLSDAACTSEFGLGRPPPGSACTLASARIVNTYQTYGRSSSRHIVLSLPDAGRVDVDVAASSSHPVFAAARAGTDRTAVVQLYHNRIVEIETSSGKLQSRSFPARRRQKFGLVGIIVGLCGVFYCLRLAFRPAIPS